MKYAILGTGNISKTYVAAINELTSSRIVACISRSGNKLIDLPEIGSWPSLDSIPVDFDAVIITTPNGLHCQGVLSAAKLGKHVITEKPLGINDEEVVQAVDACRSAGTTLAVCFQRRTAPDNQVVKQLLVEGKLGRVFSADLTAKFYRSQDYYDSADYRGGFEVDGGGVFMQQACHNLDIYAWFFGLPTTVVSMMDTFAHEIEAEDHGAALLRHENGMIGTVIASTATKPGFSARLEIHTEKGSLILVDDRIAEWKIDDIENPQTQDFQYHHDGATSASVSDSSAHKKIILDFESAIESGRKPIADGESASVTTKLITSIYRSNIL